MRDKSDSTVDDFLDREALERVNEVIDDILTGIDPIIFDDGVPVTYIQPLDMDIANDPLMLDYLADAFAIEHITTSILCGSYAMPVAFTITGTNPEYRRMIN